MRDEGMERARRGVDTVFAVVTLAVFIAIGVGVLWPRSVERMEQARAERIYARADLEATREENWERRFMVWTTALAMAENRAHGYLMAGAAVAGVVLGVVVGPKIAEWIAKRYGWE